MTPEKFNLIWDRFVFPKVSEILEKRNTEVSFPENVDIIKKNIFSRYDQMRKECKGYMRDSQNDISSESSVVMDRHKIASCMLISIIGEAPFYRQPTQTDSASYTSISRLSNYILAWHVSLCLLLSFVCKDYRERGKLKEVDFLISKGLFLPETKVINEHGYTFQTIKTIYQANKKKELSVFLLSNIFYLLEAYSHLKLACVGSFD